jgi:DNA-binding transcriptional ArsR family regulator
VGDDLDPEEDTRTLEELSPEEIAEIDKRLEAILGPPPDLRVRPTAKVGAMDDIFRTRSHVRILRAVFRDGTTENLSASEVGRRAGVSHPRALEVLRLLESSGILRAYREPGFALYEPNDEHPLAAVVTEVFKEEARLTAEADGG